MSVSKFDRFVRRSITKQLLKREMDRYFVRDLCIFMTYVWAVCWGRFIERESHIDYNCYCPSVNSMPTDYPPPTYTPPPPTHPPRDWNPPQPLTYDDWQYDKALSEFEEIYRV